MKKVVYRNLLFFYLVKHSHKIVFTQTKLNKNNFTSLVWWALIEEITPRAEEMAREKEMGCCVRGYQVYMVSSNWGSACV